MSLRIFAGAVCLGSFALFSTVPVYACDLCAIYNSLEAHAPRDGSFHLGVAEQFTEYNKLQDDGSTVDNVKHQHLASSITQLVAGHDLSDAFGLHASLPYINRRFTRIEEGQRAKGTEAGIGDLSVIAKYVPYRYTSEDYSVRTHLFAGVKFPTGDTDRLREELDEDHHGEVETEEEEHTPHAARHGGVTHGPVSAIHGHDLALGSGSWDFPVGAGALFGMGRFFLIAGVQYMIRTEGDHSYRYANDLLWNAGPAVYVALDDAYTVALRANLSGEYKGKDEGADGEDVEDTDTNSLLIGPELLVSIGDRWAIDLGWDKPINIENSGLQAVLTSRVRGAVSYRF